jgi:Carboxypeptidase regulatory-like domain/CarboxypepD_reg-like domain/TonB-dependent Receptor Plug Domain
VDPAGDRTLRLRSTLSLTVLAVLMGVGRAAGQRVQGSVIDQATGVPIVGATVVLLTSDHETQGSVVTDERGRFALRAPDEGTYLLLAQVTGYASVVSEEMELRPEITTQYRLAVAALALTPVEDEPVAMKLETLARALALACENRTDLSTQGILVGVVRDSASVLPLPDVTARLEWTEGGRIASRAVITGEDGQFVFCDVPAGTDRHIRAELGDIASDSDPIEINAGMIKRKDVFLALSDSEHPGDLIGRITDYETGEPVSGARVSIRGTDFTTLTDGSGGYAFANVPWGVYFLVVDHLAYAHQERAIRIMGDRAHEVNLGLVTEAIQLDPIDVKIRSRDWFGGMRGFRARRLRGFGYFVDRQAIERRGAIRVIDILREIPGVNVEMARADSAAIGRTTTQTLFFRNCWRYTPDGRKFATPPVFYLNGVKQMSINLASGDLDTVLPSEIEAIEVYRGPAEVPADFSGSDAGCGVIAIWTKRG